jgi:predicted nucleic acid-binding Zn ribbon protein
MPLYTYRREDGTTFDYRQKFADNPLTVDPETGQRVVRVVQVPRVIFKGSGFYVTDSKDASKASANGTTTKNTTEGGEKSSPTETVKETPAKDTSTVGAAAD